MAWTSNGANAELQAGINHQVNPGRGNDNSVTLGDAGLQADSDRWNQLTPRAVLSTATGTQNDSSWEQYQREQGSYQPGSMETMQDQLSVGNDNLT
jgi:hypothetical protein